MQDKNGSKRGLDFVNFELDHNSAEKTVCCPVDSVFFFFLCIVSSFNVLKTLDTLSAGLFWCFRNVLNSDMDHMIFNVRVWSVCMLIHTVWRTHIHTGDLGLKDVYKRETSVWRTYIHTETSVCRTYTHGRPRFEGLFLFKGTCKLQALDYDILPSTIPDSDAQSVRYLTPHCLASLQVFHSLWCSRY